MEFQAIFFFFFQIINKLREEIIALSNGHIINEYMGLYVVQVIN